MAKMYLVEKVTLLKRNADENQEKWKKEHDDPTLEMVYDLEQMYDDVLKLTDALFRRDNAENIQAAKDKDVARLEAWEKLFKVLCEAILAVAKSLQVMAKWPEVKEYRGVRVDVKELAKCEFRLSKALQPSDDYMGRGDVIEAIARAERAYREGLYQEDCLEETKSVSRPRG